MSLLTLPIELPARIVQRAYRRPRHDRDVARELPARLDALDARADRIQDQLDRALTLGETIAENTTAMVSMAERIEARGESMIELGERMIELGNAVMSSRIYCRSGEEVADRGAEVVRRYRSRARLSMRPRERSSASAAPSTACPAAGLAPRRRRRAPTSADRFEDRVGPPEPMSHRAMRHGRA